MRNLDFEISVTDQKGLFSLSRILIDYSKTKSLNMNTLPMFWETFYKQTGKKLSVRKE